MILVLVSGCGGPRQANAPTDVPAERDAEYQSRYLKALITRRPEHWRARVRLANLETAAGHDREAFRLLREAVALSPRNLGLHAALAAAAEAVDYLDWALYGWREVVRRDPRDAAGHLALAKLYRRLDWPQDADREFALALELAPRSLAVLRERAAMYASISSGPQTRALAERLVREYPQAPYGYSLLADLAAFARRWPEAVEQGRKAMERAPDDASFITREAQYCLARTDTPDPIEAARLARRAVELDSSSASAHFTLGQALKQQGQTQEALVEMEAARRLDPGLQGLALGLAELYRSLGRNAEAEAVISEYTQRQQESLKIRGATTHLERGRAHLASGDAGAALVELLAAARLEPKNPSLPGLIREALRKQERAEDSVAPLTVQPALASRPSPRLVRKSPSL